jgi:hypothetical protein
MQTCGNASDLAIPFAAKQSSAAVVTTAAGRLRKSRRALCVGVGLALLNPAVS